MPLSLAMQTTITCSFKTSIFTSPSHKFVPKNCLTYSNNSLRTSNPKATYSASPIIRSKIKFRLSSSPAAAVTDSLEEEEGGEEEETSERLGVVVKPLEKPRLVLKFIWMEKNIGIALDQVIPGHGTIPISPYYFWPRKDAWEELKIMLERKPWISEKQIVLLLNQATDIINLWQQSGGDFV